MANSQCYNYNAAMDYLRILWDQPEDPNGNVQHILEHGLSIDDVEEVLRSPASEGASSSTGRPCAWGYTLEGLYIIVIYDRIDEDTIRVTTAYNVSEPR
jgi:uncharacterized DUF497 family protein